MKNLLKVFAVAVAVVLAACSKDSVEAPAVTADEAQVTFTTTIPGATEGRAIADGSTVDKLYYAVYEHGQTQALITDEEDVVGKTATVNVTLVSGMKYDIVFWAQKEGAPYTFNTTDNRIDIDWTNLVGNNEARDAFIFVRKALEVNGSIQETITLKRPFAQLNIGISDFEAAKAAGFELAETKVSVDSYDQINFFGGEAYSKADGTGDYGMPAGTETPVTFACAAPLTDPATITIKGTTYKYVSMNYILPAMPTDAYDVDITFCTANEVKQYSVPTFAAVTFERNHRTNIMGSLLTDPGKFVIEIDEEFDDEDYNIIPWDGKTVTAPVANAAGVYEISAAAELAYIVQNGGPNTQFILMEDIDMGGYSVPARPADKATNGYIGGMDFNGNGKTIRNYKNGEIGMAGLFPVFAGHTKVYNLTLEGADISPIMGRAATYDDHCFAGALVGQIYGKVTFDKIHVKSSTIVGNNKIGAIAGHVGDNDGHVITNCSSAEDVYLKSCSPADGGSVGGLIGFFESDVTIENCVSKSKVENFMYTPEGKRGCGLLIGSIGATGGVNVTINNCDISGAEFVAVTDPDMVAANKAAEYTSPYGAIIGGTRNDKSVVVIDGNEIMISSTSLADAAKEPGAVINLAAGEYEFPAEFAAGVTLNCAEGTIFNRPEDAPISLDINGATIVGATFKGSNDAGVNLVKSPINGSFKDCTFEGYNTLRYCYPGGLVEFEGCTFKAYEYAVHFDSGSATLSFKNCVFEGTYTVGAGMESIIDECEFRSDLRKMFNIPNFYDKTTVTNSKFVFDGTATVKQSIRLHAANDDASKYLFTNCKVNDEPLADHTNYLAEKLDVGDKLTIDGVTYEYNGNNQFYVDGKLVIVPGLMLDGTTYVVSSVNGFAYLSGKTIPDTVKEIRLDADIDMQGAEFMGMANANSANGSLIFNGNNKTISNIKLAHGGHYGMTDAAGLFDSVTQRWASATFECKDLTMSGVSLANPNAVWSGAIIGYAQCEAGNTFKLTNVKVVDSTLAGKKSIGGFIGMLATPASLVAKDCSISNTAISASEKRAAGFIGCWNGEAPASVTFTNCTVGADVTYTSPSLTGEFIGENVNSTPVTFN